MKQFRFFIPLVLFFLFVFDFALRAQAPPYIAPVVSDTIVKVDTLSYEQQLGKVLLFNTPWVELTYYDLDTSARQLSLDVSFPLPNCLVSAMVRDFRSDTSLAPVAEPCKAGNKQSMFQFGKMTLKWNSRMNAFLSEGPLPLLAIRKKTINKQVKGYVMIERKKSGNVMSIYLENGKGEWYTFCYSNGNMLAYTPDEKLKSKIAKHHIARGKSPDPKYKCVLGAPNDRALILKKVKRAKY